MKTSSNQMRVNGPSSIGVMAFLPVHDDGSRGPGALIAASESVASARNYLRQGHRILTRSESRFEASRDDSPEQRDKVQVGLAIVRHYKISFAVEQEILEIINTYLDNLSSHTGFDLQESNKIRSRLDALEERREALVLERQRMAQSQQWIRSILTIANAAANRIT